VTVDADQVRVDVLVFVATVTGCLIGFFVGSSVLWAFAGDAGAYVGAVAGTVTGALGGFLFALRSQLDMRFARASAVMLVGSLIATLALLRRPGVFLLIPLLLGFLGVATRRLSRTD
jgi:hypothetical protein